MVKVEWGARRTCQACAAHFYDLQKSPIICPKCQAPYELVTQTRGRRGRQAILEEGKITAIDDLVLQDALDLPDDLADSATADLIEDTDDLDEGLADVADVIEHDREDDH